ncbi:transcription cofactor vestigial-like protein 3 [Gouania willdenowi]|uniref:Transcription cofactor vestigial-like protein 3 n=1 Tax=Gouania willdenowi TaxID=441366 RepID=A0A8C5HQE5_GOUWI|nr:transcription cofactor vestigial-like protein 3 [Gouania willdenowi]
MSCLDVMYHQSYGAHYLPYRTTYYNHHPQQQQRKLIIQSKMHECMEQQQQQQQQQGAAAGGRMMLHKDQGLGLEPAPPHGSTSQSDPKESSQPAEAEYLSSRCVLFTYFQGDIGDVVDEHFSRALSQSSSFSSETKPIRVSQSSASGLWKDGESVSDTPSSPAWCSTYPSQAGSSLSSVSVSVHPDFSTNPMSFNHPDGTLWAGHMLSQASLPPTATLSDSWTYSLNSQTASGYPNVHDIYHPHSHPHPHIHTRHHHPMLHSYQAQSPALDPRFNPLLLPAVRSQSQSATSTGSPPLSDAVKTEMDSSSPVSATWTPSGPHGSLETYDTAVDQTKAKTSVWF